MLFWAEVQAYVDEVRQECWSHGIDPVVVAPADEREEQWERLRRSLPRTEPQKGFRAEMIAAYEEATGTCLGCD